MLDRDLAELYGVETKQLKRQVRRNILRFPEDFMFQLTDKEFKNWRSQFGSSNSDKMGLRYPPYAFTEFGIAQLSCVLHSEKAILINIQIMKVFIRMRKMIQRHTEILKKLSDIDKTLLEHNDQILIIFDYLKQFEEDKQLRFDQENRNRIGFSHENKNFKDSKSKQ